LHNTVKYLLIDTVFGIKVRVSGLCINRSQPIIGRLLNADYQPANNRPFPYRCISIKSYKWQLNPGLAHDAS